MAPEQLSAAQDGTRFGSSTPAPAPALSQFINDPIDAGALVSTAHSMPLHRDRSDDTLAVPATVVPSGMPGKPTKAWMESDKDELAMPENNMLLVMPSLCLCLFLASLDQTIIAVSEPPGCGLLVTF